MKNALFILGILLLFILQSGIDIVSWNSWEEDGYCVNSDTALCPCLSIELDGGSGHGRVDRIDSIGSNQMTHFLL